MNEQSQLTNGAHHIGITVPDVFEAAAFFKEALGFDQIGEKPDYPAVFISDGVIMITLWQAEDPQSATVFDRRSNLGMHHLALRVDETSEPPREPKN